MYGYVVPHKETLRATDFVLYRSFYCGLCCQLGKLFGVLPRLTTNYDFTFLSVLLHDYAQADIVIEEHTCILNPVKKKAVLQPDKLLERIAAANILMSYQKALDGIADGDGGKYKVAKRTLKRPFEKAKAMCPEVWEEIKRSGELQDKTEREGVKSIDRAADPFAGLLRALPPLITGEEASEDMKGLCYNIGKFVYLTDALDDIEDDSKDGRYNPFFACYGGFTNRKDFIAAHKADLEFIFDGIRARAAAHFYAIKFTQSYSLLKNIVIDGLGAKKEELLSSEKKLRPPKL